jgi:hypothetical protein
MCAASAIAPIAAAPSVRAATAVGICVTSTPLADPTNSGQEKLAYSASAPFS